MRRSSRLELERAAGCLETLASQLRSGQNLRRALIQWPEIVSPECRETIRAISRWVAVGGVLAAIGELEATRSGMGAHLVSALERAEGAERRGGSFTIACIESESASLRRRAAALADAGATTSGARLSGRLVAGLPFAFLILMPVAGRPRVDPVGLLMLATGLSLVLGGLRWISRLSPAPPRAVPAAEAVNELAALMQTGFDLTTALRTVARRTTWDPLRAAGRMSLLGIGWVDGLVAADDGTARMLSSILTTGRKVGYGTSDELLRLAGDLRTQAQRDFEARLHRAPVLMVIPLVLCVLPGFALLTVGPFLRDLLA